MALQSARHVPLYAVVVVPLLGARLQAEVAALRRPLAAWGRPALLVACSLAMALGVVLYTARTLQQAGAIQLGTQPSAATYPVAAVEYLRAHPPAGNLFHSYVWGGYLIYQLYPQARVFIDGRADPYGDALLERARSIEALRPGWRQALDDYEVRLVLVQKNSPLAGALAGDPDWQEVLTGPVERLYQRTRP